MQIKHLTSILSLITITLAVAINPPNTSTNISPSSSLLTPRNKLSPICPNNIHNVQYVAYTSGAVVCRDFLSSFPSDYRQRMQARRCTMIAYNRSLRGNNVLYDAVWYCNDSNDDHYPAVSYLASFVGDIIHSCATWTGLTYGQQFDTDNFNIVVGANAYSDFDHQQHDWIL